MIFNVTGGGGTALNFKVLAYATEEALLADAPKENTIGVITETAITNWAFSTTEPAEPAEGMVWITTGTESVAEFNALKKNSIQIYPIMAKQYVDGAWVKKTRAVYQGGEWVSLSYDSLVVFASGAFTSGSYKSIDSTGSDYSSVSISNNYWTIACSSAGSVCGYTSKKFDLTYIDSLVFTARVTTGDSSYSATIKLGVGESADTSFTVKKSFTVTSAVSSTKYTIDVSALTGSYYIKAMCTRTADDYYNKILISAIKSG